MRQIFHDKYDFITQYRAMVRANTGKEFEACGSHDRFYALAELIATRARRIASENELEFERTGKKRVYYFSLEFLIGRLLDNYLLNFGIRDMVEEALEEMGTTLEELEVREPDAALGNGGLGRLAACFLASAAHENIAFYGNGMRYEYGLFKQEIVNGRQVEVADNWLKHGYPWESRRPESAVEIVFGGKSVGYEKDGRTMYRTEGGQKILAVPYDIPVVAYGGALVNKLRVWKAEPAEDLFDLDAFNRGEYANASAASAEAEAISAILYPADAGEHGKILRLKQEYLFVAAGINSILRTFENEHGQDWKKLPDYVAIHTNDTHPAMCGPELMRVLMDDKGLTWEDAWDIVTKTVSFTNHTVLPEALEKWPITTFKPLLPRLYQIIDEIARRYRESFPTDNPQWREMFQKTAILWDGEVRMANLSIICSHSVNGVAELHTQILEHDVFKEFYELTPEKFNNKTNGVTHRRFLAEANPSYAKLITSAIGDKWLDDAFELKKLEKFVDDEEFLTAMAASKRENKVRLANYIKKVTGVSVNPDSVFDVQVKRFHAYKRQLLNIFKVMDVYNRLTSDSTFTVRPTTFIFSGKAAQSYYFAKEVIRLINSVADVVNNDKRVNDLIKVAFIPNFRVSNAQLIYSAAEISEQISTAGQEASGTSNMKLMMNGAITLGTLDGANIEIADLAGRDNVKIFGLTEPEVVALQQSGHYFSWDEYNADRDRLGRCVDELTDTTFSGLSGTFDSIRRELMDNNDHDLVLKDFHSYVKAWEELVESYDDTLAWNRMALYNTANSGHFSSDRTIREYRDEIWGA